MENNISNVNATKLVNDNYQSYARYVLETRALPSVEDGLKLVQRRIIYGASQQPQKLMKTAALAGHVMKFHPHGDCSGAIYTMTSPCNRLKIFNTKGNHGGHSWAPSASRYTECYLNEVGRYNYCQFIEYADYIEGELGLQEPVSLPCLIPYSLIEGANGMGVGISTNVMPMNVFDLIDYYKDFIRNGYSNKLVKPDLGDFIIHDEGVDLRESINNSKCNLRVNPVITREGNSIVFTTLPSGKNVDYVIRKLRYEDCIDYRNESTSEGRHVFTVVDDRGGEVSPDNVESWIVWHSKATLSYSRVMVDRNGVATYLTLDSVVKKSLEVLNKAIDKMISSKIEYIESKIVLYNALELAKSKNLFDNISRISVDELVESMVKLGIDESLAREIVKKPISYLTRSHDYELDNLKIELDQLKSHNRTEYLISLYDTFAGMIKDDYNSKSHTILESQTLHNPRIRLRSTNEVEIYEGKRSGIKLDNYTYLVDEYGFCQIEYYSSKSYRVIPLDKSYIGLSTSAYKYLEIQTIKDKKGLSIATSELRYSKNLLNLTEGEKVVNVIGWNEDAPDRVLNNLVTKRSKARWY